MGSNLLVNTKVFIKITTIITKKLYHLFYVLYFIYTFLLSDIMEYNFSSKVYVTRTCITTIILLIKSYVTQSCSPLFLLIFYTYIYLYTIYMDKNSQMKFESNKIDINCEKIEWYQRHFQR